VPEARACPRFFQSGPAVLEKESEVCFFILCSRFTQACRREVRELAGRASLACHHLRVIARETGRSGNDLTRRLLDAAFAGNDKTVTDHGRALSLEFPALQAADLIASFYQTEGEKLSQIIHLALRPAVEKQAEEAREPFSSRMVKLLAFRNLQLSPDEVPGEL